MKLKKFIKKIIRKIISERAPNQFFWNPPFNYVQNITINNICEYTQIPKKDIKRWAIVGVYLGKEIPQILRKYSYVTIDAFECSERYTNKLIKHFRKNGRVKIVNKAVSSFDGESIFYETNLNGNGSLLELDELSKENYGSLPKEKFPVKTITLDTYYKNKSIDILWIDVQGAEMLVIDGAKETLTKVKAIFIEVSITDGFYKNSVKMDKICMILGEFGFNLVLLGTDFNLTGNALFVKKKKEK